MTPFNNELQVGQPAMIINVEYEKNLNAIGTIIIVEELLSVEESEEILKDTDGHAYAMFIKEDEERHIRQKYLMPLPPLGDVYDQEVMDELENWKVRA